jgi:ankyrin repeat protein
MHALLTFLAFLTLSRSPLNMAFLYGNAEMVRLLLAEGADLEYINGRAWTSLSYLWDPDMPHHSETMEVLDICFANDFNGWRNADKTGWAPIHRAEAFGDGRHIQKLCSFGASIDQETHLNHWNLLQCAARYGNMSTFNSIAHQSPMLGARSIPNHVDTRGWGLLHLAAASGNEQLMTRLLSMGADPNASSDPSSILLPDAISYKELTPSMIAHYYGHGQTYAQALKATGNERDYSCRAT